LRGGGPKFEPDPANGSRWLGDFTARSDGEVFLSINDTSIPAVVLDGVLRQQPGIGRGHAEEDVAALAREAMNSDLPPKRPAM
jgi:hypothetical protein